MVDFEVTAGTLKVNASKWVISPFIEDSEATMGLIVDILRKVRNVNRIIISNTRDIEYDSAQVKVLTEISDAINKIVNEDRLLGPEKFYPELKELFPNIFKDLTFIVLEVLRKDPITAYLRLKVIEHMLKKISSERKGSSIILKNVVERMIEIIEKIEIVRRPLDLNIKLRMGDRKIYRLILRPTIRPKFMLTRYYSYLPKDSQVIDSYYVGSTKVEIVKVPGKIRYLYFVTPKEFLLDEEKNILLNEARAQITGYKPTEKEMASEEVMRETFYTMSFNTLKTIAEAKGIKIDTNELKDLASILVRYTTGYGILEILLADDKIQDIYINSPIGETVIFINHSDYEECETNLIPTIEEAEGWATRFRLYSGRPLDETNPVLDTEITVPGGRGRVAAITRTLSPEGLGYAIRRHREKPWTFPLFIKVKAINSLYAGLMSFIIDGARTILVAGGRGSGKTSLLSSMILEIMRKFRIIVLEDTLEIPVSQIRALGYNIERLKSRSVITRVEAEMPAEEALRTALRLGDSCLFVGEVRSVEAKVLFEAMRVGALSNVVAGTIHAETAYGVYDRVVHDLGVEPTSFKAIDIINISTMLKSPDGLHRFRRVFEVVEVRKHWKEDPMEEEGFVPLMVYSAKEDTLKPTEVLLEGESEVLNNIAKRVREWHGSWDLVWENIILRSNIKQTIVDYATKLNRPEILEADFVVTCNEMFHLISNECYREVGSYDSRIIYDRWIYWFKKFLKEKLRLENL
ncbi:MAG: type II/IV secretion system ATPase subunit [Candidatus Aenigmarchaeota archaeon]|nr:type II/IV secretion system ATPase subunit [Candidatus Aenigmarchaeota archaeon]MDW8149639.1 type II/IV secretion system ATPase subunit [Candidatus Aenigmarchaeota archaeon]